MKRFLIIPALVLPLTACASGPSQSACYDGFQEALGPTIQAYANGGDDATVDAARAPIFEACGTVAHLVDGMKVYPEVVGLSDRAQVTPAALNTLCYLRADTAACEGYADYDF